ncbi:MAG: FIST C-terminal domain-containing protein [Actinobacteria bacterium]|nr:FIST C-terminal domain-containing protein [Actinomycetota bacterium]
MIVATATWAAGSGWSPALPLPPAGESVVAIAFADPSAREHPDRPLVQLADAWAGKPLVGCSATGQVSDGRALDDAVVVVTLQFDSTTVRCAHADLARSGSTRRAGRELAEAVAEPGLAAVLVLVDGLSVNGTALAEGIADVLPDVPVAGGLAADGAQFANTWTIVDGELLEGYATAVGFIGNDVEIGFGSGSGWQPFGPDRVVTRSFGNVLYELDGGPASELYLQYLGDGSDALPAAGWTLPLAVTDLDGRSVLRAARAAHPMEGSLTFTGDVPQGSTVQLARATVDGLVNAAEIAAKQASTGREQIAIAIGSAGRQTFLGEHSEHELDAMAAVLAPGARLIGFYGFGEIAPSDGCNDVHDLTMTIVTIGERSPATAEEA